MSNKPMMKYGMILPIMTSIGLTGVEINCSIVPRSHSRAMVIEVSSARTVAMIIAIRPGIRKFFERKSVLYQTRGRASINGVSRIPASRCGNNWLIAEM